MKNTRRKADRAVLYSMLRVVAAFGRLKLTSSAERPIHLTLATVIALCFLFGCETANYAPTATKEMVAASHQRDVDLATLNHGRNLFVHRCIECHTLPALWRYTPKDWTEIVNDMSHRASLKPAERDAVIAYILAVRAGER